MVSLRFNFCVNGTQWPHFLRPWPGPQIPETGLWDDPPQRVCLRSALLTKEVLGAGLSQDCVLSVTDPSQKAISEPFVRQVQVPIFAVIAQWPRPHHCESLSGEDPRLFIGACAMTTKFLDYKNCTKLMIVEAFPTKQKKAAFWTIFLSAPIPPQNSKFYFIVVLPPLSLNGYASVERFRSHRSLHQLTFGCSFFVYSWKLPTYSGAFSRTIDSFSVFTYSWNFFTHNFSFFLTVGAFCACSGKVRLISALRHCKQRSLTVSKKAPTVSKRASPLIF